MTQRSFFKFSHFWENLRKKNQQMLGCPVIKRNSRFTMRRRSLRRFLSLPCSNFLFSRRTCSCRSSVFAQVRFSGYFYTGTQNSGKPFFTMNVATSRKPPTSLSKALVSDYIISPKTFLISFTFTIIDSCFVCSGPC